MPRRGWGATLPGWLGRESAIALVEAGFAGSADLALRRAVAAQSLLRVEPNQSVLVREIGHHSVISSDHDHLIDITMPSSDEKRDTDHGDWSTSSPGRLSKSGKRLIRSEWNAASCGWSGTAPRATSNSQSCSYLLSPSGSVIGAFHIA